MVRSLEQLQADLGTLEGKKTLLRLDLNVPVADGAVVDDFRIKASTPTVDWLKEAGADITICSHLGRPKGQHRDELVMAPVIERLNQLGVNLPVLENLRFDPREKTDDTGERAAELAHGFDCFVNDAFGMAHRTEASIVGIPKLLPSAVGRLFEKELTELERITQTPERPFLAALGGLKISDKLYVIESLLPKVDALLIGGAMAFTFAKAAGHDVGDSLVEEAMVAKCANLLADNSDKLVIPHDYVCMASTGSIGTPDDTALVTTGPGVPAKFAGCDIGPESAATFAKHVESARLVLWNGPMGAFEDPRFASGTRTISEALGSSEAYTYVGGGDSAAAIAAFGVQDNIDFISSGGGASLQYLETGYLPAIEAIANSPRELTYDRP